MCGYKLKIITGDNISNAINCAYLCNFIDSNKKVWKGIIKNNKIMWEQQDMFTLE